MGPALLQSVSVTINAAKIHCTTAIVTTLILLLLLLMPLLSSLPPPPPSAGEECDDLLELHVQHGEGEGAGGQQQHAVVAAAAAAAAATRAGVSLAAADAAPGYSVIGDGNAKAVLNHCGAAVAIDIDDSSVFGTVLLTSKQARYSSSLAKSTF